MFDVLPDQLNYLAPVFSRLEKFDRDSLGDDNPEAMDVVVAALKTRVTGMDEETAEEAIQSDCESLQAWMRQPEAATSPAGYVYGVMFGVGMFGGVGELLE